MPRCVFTVLRPTFQGFAEQVLQSPAWTTAYTEIEDGSYIFETRHQNVDFGIWEYWGLSAPVTVAGGFMPSVFNRSEPFIWDWALTYDAAGTQGVPQGEEVEEGTAIYAQVRLFNQSGGGRSNVTLSVWGSNPDTGVQGGVGELTGIALPHMSDPEQDSLSFTVELTGLVGLGRGGIFLAPRLFVPGMPGVESQVDSSTDVWNYPENSIFTIVEHQYPPTAAVVGFTPEPDALRVGEVYRVTATYTDLNGKDTLEFCYLRIDHPTKPLTIGYDTVNKTTWPWAGELGESYLGDENWVDVKRLDDPGVPGDTIVLEWRFQLKPNLPKETDVPGVRFAAQTVEFGTEIDELSWTYGGPTLSFEWPHFGATVITHGFLFWGDSTEVPLWAGVMGEALGNRLGASRCLDDR